MNIYKIGRQDLEYEKLRTLWTSVFGDEPSDVDSIYDNLDATGYVLEESGDIVSSLTTFSAGTYQGRAVDVIYAVCTSPDHRGHGYAAKLVKHALSDIEDSRHIGITSPAEEGLAEYYKRLGMTHCAYEPVCEAYATDETEVAVEIIDACKYHELREAFLEGVPHVAADIKLLEQVRAFSVNGEGMLLINGGDAICIIDSGTEDEMYVSELLVHPTLLAHSGEITGIIAGALAHKFAAARCLYRTTHDYEGGQFYYGLQME